MKTFFKSNTLATGLAIFSMFFGAGNVIFPILLGQYAGDKNLFAILGLLTTAIIVPFVGLITMALFDGDYTSFFKRIGKIPGTFAIVMIMAVIGPFAAIPRCVALSHATFNFSCGETPIWLFSLLSCIIIFVFAYKKNSIVSLLGYILTPFLLLFMLIIIVKGVTGDLSAAHVEHSNTHVFAYGLQEGYNMLDLLASFFFSTIVITCVKADAMKNSTKLTYNTLLTKMFKASLIGAILLSIIYAGMSFVSAFHSSNIEEISKDQLLAAVSFAVLGSHAGLIASLATALACLTTAITLSAVFAEFLNKTVFQGKVHYRVCLLITLVITFGMSYLKFAGIVKLILPLITICYPVLIVLCLMNIAYKLFDFKLVKTPVAIAFIASLSLYFWF